MFDPEGTLGYISAAWMTCLGLQAGRVFTNFRRALAAATPEGRRRAQLRSAAVGAHVVRWVAWGLLCGVIGGALCGFAQDGGYIPINKVCCACRAAVPVGGARGPPADRAALHVRLLTGRSAACCSLRSCRS